MLIIGHRGAAGLAPENTLSSFRKSIQLGVGMIELDVRETRDGELVVIHDSNMKRSFGADHVVSELNIEQIKKLSQDQVPTLEEVLRTIDADINIEVKEKGFEKKLLSEIKNFPYRVLVSSSLVRVLKKIRTLDGNVQLGLIIPLKKVSIIPFANFIARRLNLYSIHPRSSLINRLVVKWFKRSGRKVFVWTVNTKQEYARLNNLKVDGIFTDYPNLFK